MKKIIIRIFIVSGLLFLSVFIILSAYTGSIYINFLYDRTSIFEKINEFSKVLDKETETDLSIIEDQQISEKIATVILDRQKNVITEFAVDKYRLEKLDYMPYFLTAGFVNVEDREFFNHFGLNIKRLTIALVRNILSGGRSGGGSTISQQLAKILFTTHERSIKRKVYELFCTLELERTFTKNEILQIYLNSIYLAHGNYGIANATDFYFGKSPSELTVAEAALLIGMNRSPERYSPVNYPENAKRIQYVVLNQFSEAGFIKEDDIEFEIKRFWRHFGDYGIQGEQSIWKTDVNRSGYITEYVRKILDREFSYHKITKGALIVETSFDLERQLLAERIVKQQIDQIRMKVLEKAELYGKKEEYVEMIDKLEAGFVTLDYDTGEILTIVGGSGYQFGNQLNRATNIKRQIGSTVKPFIYAYALDNEEYNIHPFTRYKDEIITYKINGKDYSPKNYSDNHQYGGMVTLYDALKRSLNTVAVQVLNDLDIPKTAQFIRRAASVSKKNSEVPEVLSLALGTAEFSPLQLASAVSIFPRLGDTVYPSAIKRIYDRKGTVYYDIERRKNPFFNFLTPEEFTESQQLINEETAYEVVQMMKGVFEEGGTGYWAGRRFGLDKEAYGKSGTTQDYRDGWFVGFTSSEVSVAWVGMDNNRSIYLSGSSTAANIWASYNSRISVDYSRGIQRPSDMKLLTICKETGLRAGPNCTQRQNFYFKHSSFFPEECYIHNSDVILLE